MTCYIPRWFTRLQTITHPSTNRAQLHYGATYIHGTENVLAQQQIVTICANRATVSETGLRSSGPPSWVDFWNVPWAFSAYACLTPELVCLQSIHTLLRAPNCHIRCCTDKDGHSPKASKGKGMTLQVNN